VVCPKLFLFSFQGEDFGKNNVSSTLIRIYDEAGNVIGTHEQAGEFHEF